MDLDPTRFFSDLKDGKKLIFSHIFSENLPTGTLFSIKQLIFLKKFEFFEKNFVLEFHFASNISVR